MTSRARSRPGRVCGLWLAGCSRSSSRIASHMDVVIECLSGSTWWWERCRPLGALVFPLPTQILCPARPCGRKNGAPQSNHRFIPTCQVQVRTPITRRPDCTPNDERWGDWGGGQPWRETHGRCMLPFQQRSVRASVHGPGSRRLRRQRRCALDAAADRSAVGLGVVRPCGPACRGPDPLPVQAAHANRCRWRSEHAASVRRGDSTPRAPLRCWCC